MLRCFVEAFPPAIVLMVPLMLTACGGKVVFVGDDAPGGAPSGVDAHCPQFCELYDSCFPGDCLEECQGLFSGACDSEAAVRVDCFVKAFAGDCGTLGDDTCIYEMGALSNCQTGSACFSMGCEQPDSQTCSCSGTCSVLDDLEQHCVIPAGLGDQPPEDAPLVDSSCDCFLDGNYIGSCESPITACSIEEACCQKLVGGFE